LDQRGYNRAEPEDTSAGHESKKERPIEGKESFRRLETLERSTVDIPEGTTVITVCDREGDRYGLFARARSLEEPVLVRIVRNRMTVENRKILDEIRKERCRGRVAVRLPRDSRSGIPEREAVLRVRYASYSVKRPQIWDKVKTWPDTIDLPVISVKEEKPVKGREPVEWLRKLRFRWRRTNR
jgi:hypothetical protein